MHFGSTAVATFADKLERTMSQKDLISQRSIFTKYNSEIFTEIEVATPSIAKFSIIAVDTFRDLVSLTF